MTCPPVPIDGFVLVISGIAFFGGIAVGLLFRGK